ncbi:hypothetical protein [Lignipirellula cremea]|uniref:Lipoprotein n=1 Tax=Lignipirellula cremea TaxID=2528010 RepID=A0A518DM18_9BACT|nr:hypothetical protein [Lignipirellula cremea]QDU92887.1 hypothetical protein Pla8534_06600 [Lignipirellula cremea]
MNKHRTIIGAIILVTVLLGCSSEPGKSGNVRSAPKAVLLGDHLCTGLEGAEGDQFLFLIGEEEFEIRAANGPLPMRVVQAIIGQETEVASITGKWQYAEGRMTLSELCVDGNCGDGTFTLRPLVTPVLRVHLGGHQYKLTRWHGESAPETKAKSETGEREK